jgi:copper homeostasis protein
MPMVLEVIVCSVRDAVAAAEGGAGRLEIISRFDLGGLTPDPDLVEAILKVVQLPIRVMLRESPGYTITDRAERLRLLDAARRFAQMPVDGLVLGFLRNGDVDEDLLGEILAAAPSLQATFHRAFEDVQDPAQAVAALKRFPQIDRILTGGGPGDLPEKVKRLSFCARCAAPEIIVLAGGGITAESIPRLRDEAGIREFHTGRAARVRDEVDADCVREIVEVLNAKR